ncbi:MAG: dCMP deaminase family protein [Chitinispirillales bacterium]|jgi:dCMP deaminase|nr:dCMP deaminase family protein [Chitinispirillales bacterium]
MNIQAEEQTTVSASAPAKRKRASWDEYFMQIALQAATRSTCDRKHVGAVIVRDKAILSTGYNGSVRGMPHCDDVGHMMVNTHCVATVHAEANAIIQAAKNGTAIDGADIYVTASPCWNCFKLIANSGIRRVFYLEFYRDEKVLAVSKEAGIEMRQVEMAGTESL